MCRLYAHTLLVLDDDDFYERQDTFTLAQQRGIVTALNALVFRTYCPASSGETLTLTVRHSLAFASFPALLFTPWFGQRQLNTRVECKSKTLSRYSYQQHLHCCWSAPVQKGSEFELTQHDTILLPFYLML